MPTVKGVSNEPPYRKEEIFQIQKNEKILLTLRSGFFTINTQKALYKNAFTYLLTYNRSFHRIRSRATYSVRNWVKRAGGGGGAHTFLALTMGAHTVGKDRTLSPHGKYESILVTNYNLALNQYFNITS